jgi:cell division protein FtsQ
MFGFSKPSRNRRQERGFQLDVKLRTEAAQRGHRRGWVRFVVRLVILALLLGGGYGGVVFARHQWLHRVDALALRKLPVQTDGVLSEREIIGQAGLKLGLNTFAIDLPTVRTRLLRHPRIAVAEVHRELPDTIRLHIRERFPVARVKAVSQPGFELSYLLDETGNVMLPFVRGQVPADSLEAEAALPLLVGVPSAPFVVGRPMGDSQILAALRFLASFEEATMAGLTDVVSVDVGRPQEIDVQTVLGSKVTFGIRDTDPRFETQLRHWLAVHQDAAGRGRLIGTLDLSVTNHAPMRWLDAATAPVETPRPQKPKRKIARRHV